MRKFKIFWDFEKEEQYLREMALKGYIFEKSSLWGFYHFKKAEPQELNYRIDCKNFKSRQAFDDYIALFEDAGWKHISGGRFMNNQYFLPMNENAGDDIFSDKESAARRYKTFQEVCLTNFTLFMIDWVIFATGDTSYLPTWGFYTPGLWQMKGKEFWFAFLFELPFAFCRMVLPLFFLITAVLFAYWAYKAKKAFKDKTKEGALYVK